MDRPPAITTSRRERPEDPPKPFLEHLEELRWTILGCVLALGLGMALAAPLAPRIFRLLWRPLAAVTDRPGEFLKSLEITGGFAIIMRLVFWCGLLFSAPVILLLAGRFVFPGLRRQERAVIGAALGAAVMLFAAGAALAYWLVLPLALRVMLEFHQWLGIQAWWTAGNYIAFAVHLLIAFGLAFELPLALLALGALNIISSSQLRAKRSHAIVILLILAAVMTPPDVFSQVAMAAPLLLLYEICIWSLRLLERRAGR